MHSQASSLQTDSHRHPALQLDTVCKHPAPHAPPRLEALPLLTHGEGWGDLPIEITDGCHSNFWFVGLQACFFCQVFSYTSSPVQKNFPIPARLRVVYEEVRQNICNEELGCVAPQDPTGGAPSYENWVLFDGTKVGQHEKQACCFRVGNNKN